MTVLDRTIAGNKTGGERIVHVALGERAYDVFIGPGLLAQAGRMAAKLMPRARAVIVTDTTVAAHHLASLEAAIKDDCTHLGSIVIPPGEATKSFAELERLCDRLLHLGLERGDFLMALGGGVVGDLVGFAASVLRRGVRLVQVPTTLLAQVDSAVGGKTGINSSQGKNLIGTFHQPSLVIVDPSVLNTLDERQLRSGYAEVVKYGLIADADFFAWLEANWRQVLGSDGEARAYAIETSCRAKADIVAADERESGDRALLNLGHTFAHALETSAGYADRLIHGEAVAIGIMLAFELSRELGLCEADDSERVAAHLKAVGLPTGIAGVQGEAPSAKALIKVMTQDKKVRRTRPVLILVRGIGRAFIEPDMAWDGLEAFIAQKCEIQ